MSRILLIPGTKWQIALGKKIKQLGHELYVVSPEKEAPCKTIADGYFQSDIFSVDMIEKYARDNRIEAIVSDECDIVMPVIAELGNRLELKTLSTEAATIYTNKYIMREFANKIGINVPEYCLCRTMEDAEKFLNSIKGPIVIKPLDSNASHGVFVIHDINELKDHYNESLSFSRQECAILAERYIQGTEFTIDGIKAGEKHYTLAISEKKHFKHNPSIADELFFTHSNMKFDYELLIRTNDIFVMASPLEFGLTHAEYKYENGEYYLIEIGARGGGNMISSVITEHMSGIDTYNYLIDYSLGNETVLPQITTGYSSRAAVLKFFQTPGHGGRVKKIRGIEYLEKESAIKAFGLNFKEGDYIADCVSDSARIGFYIACTMTKTDLINVMNNIEKEFIIEME